MTVSRAVGFPPGPTGVLVPLGDRKGAARGLTLYTASRRTILLAQWLAWAYVRTAGPALLPGPRELVDLPYLSEIEAGLSVGSPFESVSLYRRRESVRAGATFIATRQDAAPMLIKVRTEGLGLEFEQRLLESFVEGPPSTFSTPRPLGTGRLTDGMTWSAQQMVFDAPHRPCRWLPPGFGADLDRLLAGAFSRAGIAAPSDHPQWTPAHGDLTPWNVRADRRGMVWIFDWEDATFAPAGSDRLYFDAAMGVVKPSAAMPPGSPEAAAYCLARVQARLSDGHPDGPNLVMAQRLTAAATT